MAVLPLQVAEGVDDVLEPVHVVSVDVPVAQVPVRLVLDVSNVRGHYFPGHVVVREDALLEHGHLEFAQQLQHETVSQIKIGSLDPKE